ncbi:hypothetical protein EV363DRAFT_1452806 [Boletus edulis]|nr:hypothetical protein EV363DRAFT_1452806 [Boletus edulis]
MLSPMIPKVKKAHSSQSPEYTDDKHTDRRASEENVRCAVLGKISEFSITIEGEEQATWFVYLLVFVLSNGQKHITTGICHFHDDVGCFIVAPLVKLSAIPYGACPDRRYRPTLQPRALSARRRGRMVLEVVMITLEQRGFLCGGGSIEAAYKVLARAYARATPEQVERKLSVLHATVRQSIEIANSTTIRQRLGSMLWNRRTLSTFLRPLLCSFGSGFNLRHIRKFLLVAYKRFDNSMDSIHMYCSASLFQEIGLINAMAVGVMIAGTNFVFTLIAPRGINIVGRRQIMLYSAPGMIVRLNLAAVAFHFRGIGTPLVTASNWSLDLIVNLTYLIMADLTP